MEICHSPIVQFRSYDSDIRLIRTKHLKLLSTGSYVANGDVDNEDASELACIDTDVQTCSLGPPELNVSAIEYQVNRSSRQLFIESRTL